MKSTYFVRKLTNEWNVPYYLRCDSFGKVVLVLRSGDESLREDDTKDAYIDNTNYTQMEEEEFVLWSLDFHKP